MKELWYKFEMGSYVVYKKAVYKVCSVTSDNQEPNKYALERLFPKEAYPIRDINENELVKWSGLTN